MTVFKILFFGSTFSFFNWFEFLAIYKDVFLRREYDLSVAPHTSKPLIIDCGAHIGLPVLFFKQKYPQARVLAFEPTPTSFKLLKQNIRQNRLKNVQVINAAVWKKTGQLQFSVNHNPSEVAWGNSAVFADHHDQHMKLIKVKAARLSTYITGPVELLKLDIEGAELVVLKEVAPKLKHIREIILEFHGHEDNGHELGEILSLLKKHHFSYSLTQLGKVWCRGVSAEKVNRQPPYLVLIRAVKNTH